MNLKIGNSKLALQIKSNQIQQRDGNNSWIYVKQKSLNDIDICSLIFQIRIEKVHNNAEYLLAPHSTQ